MRSGMAPGEWGVEVMTAQLCAAAGFREAVLRSRRRCSGLDLSLAQCEAKVAAGVIEIASLLLSQPATLVPAELDVLAAMYAAREPAEREAEAAKLIDELSAQRLEVPADLLFTCCPTLRGTAAAKASRRAWLATWSQDLASSGDRQVVCRKL